MNQESGFAGCFGTDRSSRLVFAGLPEDSQSSYCRGCREGPRAIRKIYDARAYNASSEAGVDLAGRIFDAGDLLSASDWAGTSAIYRDFSASLFGAGRVPFLAGGDHAVTVPVLEGAAALGEALVVLQLDAHPDLYPAYQGNRASHASTGARILEMEHVRALHQFGVRTFNPPQWRQAKRFAGRLVTIAAREIEGSIPQPDLPRGTPVYLSVDLDVFDPAFAPGVSHPVPGGLTPRQVLNWMQKAHWRLVGMDVVELNPTRDPSGMTALLAARLLHQAMALPN